ncbi:serine/threonine-protein kinase [Kitasatospora sp. NBC_00315]|uniref:serine/threonine-protein kinase n=1 Tax=Kitasatospora sp. NBC_00315 TaxID=2975963 RepID=UPI0032520CD6
MNDRGRTPLDIPAGSVLAGVRITGLIGSGGWSSVYAAERVADGAPVAVKLLRPDLLSPGQRATMAELAAREVRFSREADHPHLIRTFATATLRTPEDPRLDGAVALVMERADRSLRDALSAATPGRPLPGAERILGEVCAGLAHMHRRGWVHGDLKGANILLMADDTVRLADFGLTAELEGTHAYVPPLGSLDHVPPEWWSQRAGSRGVPLRPSADVWAFGVIAHQVLTGGLHPFLGATARARSLTAQAYARGACRLRLHEGLSEPWRAIVVDCLQPDQAERARLTSALLAARVHSLAATAAPRRRRARRAALFAAGAALVLGLGTATVVVGGPATLRTYPPPAPAPTPATGAARGVTGTARGALPEDSDVPRELRAVITDTARRCPEPEVTPALLAAMLKAESGFDPAAANPSTQEYGIAMWTPAVFNAWAQDGDNDGDKDYMSAPDAIVSMGDYVCWLDQRFKHRGMTEDLPALVVAGYRTSDKTVADAGGVPERVRAHVDKVMDYLAQYTR